MSERIYRRDVKRVFDVYTVAAREIGYNVEGWTLQILTTPVLITAARGEKGPDSMEPLPGLPLNIGTSYRDAYNAIATAARTLLSVQIDRPQTNTRGLYRYEVHGRYNTSYIDLMYDVKRDGSYTEVYETSVANGSRKSMHSLAIRLNSALFTDPTQTIRSDRSTSYVRAAEQD
jgi:hypothetical protein